MKRTVLIVMVFVLAIPFSVFAKGQTDVVDLEFAIKESGPTLEAYRTLVDDFNTTNEGIQVEVVTYGKDYGVPPENSFRKLTKWRCVPRSFAPAVRT